MSPIKDKGKYMLLHQSSTDTNNCVQPTTEKLLNYPQYDDFPFQEQYMVLSARDAETLVNDLFDEEVKPCPNLQKLVKQYC